MIRDLNKRVGIMLAAKYGTKRAVVTLVKVAPVAGAVVCGSINAAFPKAVSTGAKKAFPPAPPPGAAVFLIED